MFVLRIIYSLHLLQKQLLRTLQTQEASQEMRVLVGATIHLIFQAPQPQVEVREVVHYINGNIAQQVVGLIVRVLTAHRMTLVLFRKLHNIEEVQEEAVAQIIFTPH